MATGDQTPVVQTANATGVGVTGTISSSSGTSGLIGGNQSSQWNVNTGSSGIGWVTNPIYGTTLSATYSPTPPKKSEQKVETLTRSQVLSVVKHILTNKKLQPVLESMIGSWEAPDLNDLIYISNLLSSVPREPVIKQNMDSSLNALKSLSNLFSAVSKELDKVVAEGRAEVVEEITK